MNVHVMLDKPLQVLREELGRTLRQVQAELEAYLNDSAAAAGLPTVTDKMDQVRGVFLMLEQADAAALAQEIATLLQGLAQGRVENRQVIQQTLVHAVLQFSAWLSEWRQDTSLPSANLWSLQSELRVVQGLAPLPAPTLDNSVSRAVREDRRELAARLRPALQRALLGVLRGQQVADNLTTLAGIFGQLREHSAAEPAGRFWGLAEALLQELNDGGLPLTQPLHLLLRDLDNQVKYLSETGRIFSGSAVEQALEHRLIEHLGSSNTGLARLQNRLDLQPPPAGAAAYQESADSVTPPDMAAVARVCDLLRESLNQVKEHIEYIAHTREAHDELQQAIAGLRTIANVLILLNRDRIAEFLQPARQVLQQWQTADTVAEEDCIRLAVDLVLLESSLQACKEWGCEPQSTQGTATAPEMAEREWLQAGQWQRTTQIAFQEAVQVMQRARVMAATALERGMTGLWQELEALLHSIGGPLVLLEYSQVAELMQALESSVSVLAQQEDSHPAVPAAVAEAMFALEYNLEILGEGKKLDTALLHLAQQPLQRLDELLQTVDYSSPADSGKMALQQPMPAPTDNTMQLFAAVAEAAEAAEGYGSTLELVEPLQLTLSEEVSKEQKPWNEIDAAAAAGRPDTAITAATLIVPAQESPPPAQLAAEPVDPEILEIFFEELRSELAAIRQNVPVWRNNPAAKEVLAAIRRSFHTLKGSGRMVQQWAIGNFAGSFEQLLNSVRDGRLALSSQIVDWVDEAQRVLYALVDAGQRDSAETTRMAELRAHVETLLQSAAGYAEQDTYGQPVADLAAAALPAAPSPLESVSPARPATAAPPAKAVAEVDPELIEIFQYEANEILDSSDLTLERWKEEPTNDRLLNDLRRAMHTLKGSSRMAGFMVIGDLAHAIESVLDQIPNRSLQDRGVMVDALQRGLDRLNSMLVDLQSGGEIEPAGELIRELKTLVGEPVTGRPQPAVVPQPPAAVPPSRVTIPPVSPEPVVEALTELDRETVEVFQSEAAEILDASDIALHRWNEAKDNTELLDDLRQRIQTLKNSARIAGFPVIAALAHAIQAVLDALGKNLLQPSAALVETLQRALDGLNERLMSIQSGRVIELEPADTLIDQLTTWLTGIPGARAAPVVTVDRQPRPRPLEKAAALGAEDTIRVSTALLNQLINDMGESSIYRARIDQGLATLRFNLSEMDQTVYRLRQQLRRLEIETETQILSRYDKGDKEHEKEFDPLELDRFSELQQLSRSLMEVVEDLNNIKSTLQDQTQEMSGLLEQQAKANKEVQQGLVRTRMVRFSTVEPRLRRVLRQAAQELGKRAELRLEGAESEVDRTVLENMVAPLEHMLRNAISHGIELPERRLASGKSEVGVVTLAIRREGAELVIDLRDDGAGLNFEAIRAKGEVLGLLKAGQAVTQNELIALLMRPGFTTATKVTQIAGRGVGLDILNDAIKALRGTLLIQTEPGKGTDFIIRLPFSLVVTPALLVQVEADTYAVPLLSIESVARLEETELCDYLEGKSVEHKQGNYSYPLHNLGILFGVNSIKPYDEMVDKRPPILLFRNAEANAALQVDAVLGNQEIIIKPLGPQFQSLTGIAGATVLGDGRVVMVLDLAAMVRNLASLPQRQAEARALDVARHEVRTERIKAMVIDDSITMRKVTSRFLERQNMSVTAAKDGLEAVAKLEEQIPDVIILDIEMPRMDGFELAAHIRNQPHLRHIPIIMVTSRGGEKHRERAAKLGVNEYLTKPYQEDEMLAAIRSVLGERALELRSKPVL